MKKRGDGKTRAYILNLLRHVGYINEYDLSYRIAKRFHEKRMRPADIRKLFIKPLIELHWLEEMHVKDEIVYGRIGDLYSHISPEETLRDQFPYVPQPEDILSPEEMRMQYLRAMEQEEPYFSEGEEEEYDEFYNEEHKKSIEHQEYQNNLEE